MAATNCRAKKRIQLVLFTVLLGFFILLQLIFPDSSYGGFPNLMAAYYSPPIVMISAVVCLLLLAERYGNLRLDAGVTVKWLLRIALFLLALWYLCLVNNFIGPFHLPSIIAESSLLAIDKLMAVSKNLTRAPGIMVSLLYGVGLYLAI